MEPTAPANDGKKRAIVAIAAVAILALLAAGAFALKNNQTATTGTPPGTSSSVADQPSNSDSGNEASSDTNAPAGTYKNGTYSATGSYVSPGGTERVTVTVTLKDDTITNANVAPEPASPTSTQYQSQFVAGFRQFVVGKDADNVSVSKVSGSSLTSRGFNDALEQIKQQAKA